MWHERSTYALNLLKDASCPAASSDRQRGVRRAGCLFELSLCEVGHRETTQCSRAVALVDGRQRPNRVFVQPDRLIRLAGRQPAVRALNLNVARRAVRAMPLVCVAYGIARCP